jgi:hypothetical protein
MTRDPIIGAGLIGILLLAITVYLEARGDYCGECVRPFAVFGEGWCFRCWRRRVARSRA